MSFTIRPARPGEAGLALAFVCEFAEWHGEVVGFAVWLFDYSTFTGRHGFYLEDLFVRPAHRGKGIGKSLGAVPLDEWAICRVSGDALKRLTER